jgi:hypothetical protein
MPLLVVGPEVQDFDNPIVTQNLIDKLMLDVDSP